MGCEERGVVSMIMVGGLRMGLSVLCFASNVCVYWLIDTWADLVLDKGKVQDKLAHWVNAAAQQEQAKAQVHNQAISDDEQLSKADVEEEKDPETKGKVRREIRVRKRPSRF
ncbi:hypothetical protein L484_005557 [Morus notabilis]|uniref:Uncharacterized protein n=1 Tax=Morus notabilis TaxID=981085 RepID=W9QY62_9ROSA|nr:hypothetical protein L484_005557 [Morus notabilis]